MTAPRNARGWAFTPVFGLRLLLAIIAIILYIVFLTEAAPNYHLLAWAGILTAVGLLVP